MKKYIYIIVSVFAANVLVSCESKQSAPNAGEISDHTIGFSEIEVSPELTKSADASSNIYEIDNPETSYSMTVTETVEPLVSDEYTKAGDTTRETLKSGFHVDGYLGNETTLEAAHFLSAVPEYDNTTDLWYLNNGAKWRNNVTHRFWGTYPTDLTYTVSSDHKSINFDYTTDFTKDVVVAYQMKFWNGDVCKEGGVEHAGDNLVLPFRHVLSGVKVNTSGSVINFMQKLKGSTEWSGATPAPDGRGSVLGYGIRTLTTGKCETSGSTISWSDVSTIANPNFPNDGSSLFVIPQDIKNSQIVVNIRDAWRDFERPVFIDIVPSESSAKWDPGYKYSYKLDGKIYFPYLEENREGIDAHFNGKGFDYFMVIDDFDATYVQTVEVTWTGLGDTTGQGTFYSLGMHPHGELTKDKLATYYPDSNLSEKEEKELYADKDWVGFRYNAKRERTVKGEITGGSTMSTYECKATFDLTNKDGIMDLYLVYTGASSGHQGEGCNWNLTNMKIKIIKWKDM